MKKLCPKCISIFFAGIFFSAVLGLSLCFHSNGQWHFTPAKTHDCVGGAGGVEAFAHVDETCIDVGFDFDSELIVPASLVKVVAFFVAADTFEAKVPAAPVTKYEIFSVKNAPPDIIFGELYNNITARLLI